MNELEKKIVKIKYDLKKKILELENQYNELIDKILEIEEKK